MALEAAPATPAELLSILRSGLEVDRTDPTTQLAFEAWARRDVWRAHSEALPLLTGVLPQDWDQHLDARALNAAAQAMWHALATDLDLDPATDPPLPPLKIRRWAERNGLEFPLALGRLLDFIARVLPAPDLETSGAAEALVLQAQEHTTVLGAALFLVTHLPGDCVDEQGVYDAPRIAQLIRAKAVSWFPLAPPRMSEAEIARLIGKWLTNGGV